MPDLLNPLNTASPDARLYARLAELETRVALLTQGSSRAYAEALGQITVSANGGGFPFTHPDGPKITFTLQQDQYVGVLGSVETQAGSASNASIQIYIDGTNGFWTPYSYASLGSPFWTPLFAPAAPYGSNEGRGMGMMAYFWLAAGTHTAEMYYGGTNSPSQFRNRRLMVAL